MSELYIAWRAQYFTLHPEVLKTLFYFPDTALLPVGLSAAHLSDAVADHVKLAFLALLVGLVLKQLLAVEALGDLTFFTSVGHRRVVRHAPDLVGSVAEGIRGTFFTSITSLRLLLSKLALLDEAFLAQLHILEDRAADGDISVTEDSIINQLVALSASALVLVRQITHETELDLPIRAR